MKPAVALPFEYDPEAVAEFCRKHHIRKMSIFGSALRDDFTPESDVDVLIEYDEGHRAGLAFFVLGEEFSEIIGREADVVTKDWLSHRWRHEVLAEAVTIYDAP